MVRLTLTLAALSMGLLHAEVAKKPAKPAAPAAAKTPEKAKPKHVDSVHIKHIAKAPELAKLLKGKKPIVIEFHFPECGACGMQDPLFSKIADALHGTAEFVKINTTKDDGEKLAGDAGIEAVPTIIIFNGGKRVQTIRGGHPANALTYLQGLIENGLKKTEAEKIEVKKEEPKKADKKK